MEHLIISEKDQLLEIVNTAVREAIQISHQSRKQDLSDVSEILTDREAQKLLKKSRSTLQRWRNEGILPYKKINGSILYRREDLLALAK